MRTDGTRITHPDPAQIGGTYLGTIAPAVQGGTVTEEFRTTRARFRWGQLVGMARYAASMYGDPTPGYAEAVQLLGLSK